MSIMSERFAKRVLLVEDQTEIIDLVVEFVGTENTTFVIAKNFDEATKALSHLKFDLIVTDFNFPGGNGNMVAAFAAANGYHDIWLHTGDVENPEIVAPLFTAIYPKLNRAMIAELKAA